MILQTQYSASKHAVKGFTDGLRMELERDGAPISVTLIKPSAIDTPIRARAERYMKEEPALPPSPTTRTWSPRPSSTPPRPAGANSPWASADGSSPQWIRSHRGSPTRMELAGYSTRATSRPERPQMRDNLYRARQDGDEYSSLPGEPRRTSLFLAAQMHPLATATVLADRGGRDRPPVAARRVGLPPAAPPSRPRAATRP